MWISWGSYLCARSFTQFVIVQLSHFNLLIYSSQTGCWGQVKSCAGHGILPQGGWDNSPITVWPRFLSNITILHPHWNLHTPAWWSERETINRPHKVSGMPNKAKAMPNVSEWMDEWTKYTFYKSKSVYINNRPWLYWVQ